MTFDPYAMTAVIERAKAQLAKLKSLACCATCGGASASACACPVTIDRIKLDKIQLDTVTGKQVLAFLQASTGLALSRDEIRERAKKIALRRNWKGANARRFLSMTESAIS